MKANPPKYSILVDGALAVIAALAFVGLVMLSTSGCDRELTQSDIDTARENVAEEQQETEQARREAADAVADEQRETEQARREAFKPPVDRVEDESDLDRVREEERETEEVREDEQENIREEEQETQDAASLSRKLEAQLTAQVERDAYVKQVEAHLARAEDRVEQLNEQAADLEGRRQQQGSN